MIPLLVTIPVAANDIGLVSSLLSHLQQLGPPPNHAVLFVADHGLARSTLDPILAQAKPIFINGGGLVYSAIPMTPAYPHAHNLRFETALRHISANERCPFLWLDPRCVPTRKGWLTELEREYFARRKPVMGQVLTPATHGTAQPIVSSIAVYSPDLPKRVMQRLIAQRGVDWEKSCADLLMPIAHDTALIWVHPVNGTNALPKPPAQAALVHTAQARAYAAVVQGKKPEPAANTPAPAPEPPAPPPPATVQQSQATASYYHSGDLGDIIYALAAIRLAGGGRLILGPKSRGTPPPANPMRDVQFSMFKPLLEVQPYLSKVIYSETYPRPTDAFDLNVFRTHWGDKGIRARTGISTLVRMHCHTLGVDEKFHPSQTWLAVPSPIQTGLYTVHRSPRYRSDDDHKFPWPSLVKRYAGKLLFVGLPQEHTEFQNTFSCKTAFWKCQDFLELARIIAGSLGFIGNQSFPCAIALGLGQRVLQEAWQISPDCVFSRPNFLMQPFNNQQLDAWESSKQSVAMPEPPVPVPVVDKPAPIEITSQPRRRVTTTPINGFIELGPLNNAYGLGDTLTITPLAEKLGQRAVVCLPESMSNYALLFDGLCPVRITDDYPVFEVPPKGQRFIEAKLRQFGFVCEDGKVAPVVRVNPAAVETARSQLKQGVVNCIFHTKCASQWSKVRSRPAKWFTPITTELCKHFTLTTTANNTPLQEVIALYKAVGRYVGVNTGNWHLAMAVGCKCLVMDAEECEGYDPALWRYTLPSVEYSGFNHENIIAKIPWLINQKVT